MVGGGTAVFPGAGDTATVWAVAEAGGGTAVFTGGGTVIFVGGGTAVLVGGGTAILGGGTEMSVARGAPTFADGRATELADDAAEAPVAAGICATAVGKMLAGGSAVATGGTGSDGGGTSYFFLAAYCAYWCRR